jgi:hypothetical protein
MVVRKYNSIEEAMEMNRKMTLERYHARRKKTPPKKCGRKPLTPEQKEERRIKRNAYSKEYYRKRKEKLLSEKAEKE